MTRARPGVSQPRRRCRPSSCGCSNSPEQGRRSASPAPDSYPVPSFTTPTYRDCADAVIADPAARPFLFAIN